MGYDVKMILDLYKQQAKLHGEKGESTIQDIRTRKLEMEAIFKYLEPNKFVLEVGCGNGYVAEEIIRKFDVDLHAIDFSPEMVTIARNRNVAGLKGRVKFDLINVLEFSVFEQYDIVFTERCLQNIMDWELQKVALKNIAYALKKNGKFIMLESFTDGHKILNLARRELDLPEVPVPYHNLMFDSTEVKNYLSQWFTFIHEDRFLSGYYFGTRIIYPAMLPAGKEPCRDSVIKDYFVGFPNNGDFCPMKILYFIKK